MIDFRYHLVSLISVFLALAVGVVLGAGPLQNSLGTALNDQVTSLRADRNDIQAQLEDTEAAVNDRDSYITAAAQSSLPGTLTGRNVALVILPDASGDDVDSATAAIETAGGTVDGRVTLSTAWVDASRETFRSTYSAQFSGYLSSSTATDGNGVLGEGLATALTTSDSSATALRDLLVASDTPLATIDAEPTVPADMILVIGPRAATDAQAAAAATASSTASTDPTAWVPALTGAASVATTVVVGASVHEDELVASLRSADAPVTTIDSVGQAAAAASVPLALASTAAGTIGAYGFNDGADAVIPPAAG